MSIRRSFTTSNNNVFTEIVGGSGSGSGGSQPVVQGAYPTYLANPNKFRPGHYMKLWRRPLENPFDPTAGYSWAIDNPGLFKGVIINYDWGKGFETSRGVYNWATLDQYVDYAVSNNLVFILQMWHQLFGAGCGNTPAVPPYIYNGSTAVYGGSRDCYRAGVISFDYSRWLGAMLWNDNVRARMLDAIRATAQRYDSVAECEGFIICDETADANTGPLGDGFSNAANLAAVQDLALESKAAWPNTQVFYGVNFLKATKFGNYETPAGDFAGWLTDTARVGLSWPDTSACPSTFTKFYRDVQYTACIAGGDDVPILAQVQLPNLVSMKCPSKSATNAVRQTADDIAYSVANPVSASPPGNQNAHYCAWSPLNGYKSDILAAVAANPLSRAETFYNG